MASHASPTVRWHFCIPWTLATASGAVVGLAFAFVCFLLSTDEIFLFGGNGIAWACGLGIGGWAVAIGLFQWGCPISVSHRHPALVGCRRYHRLVCGRVHRLVLGGDSWACCGIRWIGSPSGHSTACFGPCTSVRSAQALPPSLLVDTCKRCRLATELGHKCSANRLRRLARRWPVW
jgi:hypothetical protein